MTKALMEEIEETRKALESLGSDEAETEQEEPEQAEAEAEREAPTEVEEQPAAEPKKEEAEPEDKDISPSAWRRMRLEAQAEKRRNEELQRRLSELESKMPAQQVQQPQEERFFDEPQKDAEIEQLKIEKRYRDAEQGYLAIEQQYKSTAPSDFDDVTTQYKMRIYQNIMMTNPDMSEPELLEATRRTLIETAASLKFKGYDPAEQFYLTGKKLGFGELKRQEAEQEAPEIKPDLSKVMANKKRNAGTAGAKGSGDRAQMTPLALSSLPAHEYAKIPLHERKKIMQSLPREAVDNY